MHFSSAILVLASVFIVGSNALNMFVSHLLLPSSEGIAYNAHSDSRIEYDHHFPYQGLTVADLVKQYQSLQAATVDLIELPPRRPLLRSAQPAVAIRA